YLLQVMPGERTLVAEQDGAFGGRRTGEGGAVDLRRVSRLLEAFEGADAGREREEATDLAVDRVLLDLTGPDGLDERIAPGPDRTGHREVLRVLGALHAAHSGPVADDNTVEAPVRVERGLEQVVLGRGRAVDRVVRA